MTPADADPLVSIITPAYNQADFLPETMESVLAQTFPGIDYLVIDDGSTDSTAEVLRTYAGRVRFERQPNAGQARTLNRGWAEARGTYFGYLSSDDTLHPRAVEKLVAVLENDPGVVCVFPDADLIDVRSKVVKHNVCRPFDLEKLIVEQECYIGPGALFRRDAFEQVGGWKPELRLAPDREFWMRLARHGRFAFLPEPLAGYRLHPSSISYRVVSEQQSLEYIRVLDGYFAAGAPPEVAARRDEAYGRAHFLIARNCLRGRDWTAARRHYSRAVALHPALRGPGPTAQMLKAVVGKPLRAAAARLRDALSPR